MAWGCGSSTTSVSMRVAAVAWTVGMSPPCGRHTVAPARASLPHLAPVDLRWAVHGTAVGGASVSHQSSERPSACGCRSRLIVPGEGREGASSLDRHRGRRAAPRPPPQWASAHGSTEGRDFPGACDHCSQLRTAGAPILAMPQWADAGLRSSSDVRGQAVHRPRPAPSRRRPQGTGALTEHGWC